jgi:hypothetical protein
MGRFLQLRDFEKYQASAFVLIAANVLPLIGVVFFGWDAFAIISLYWVENVVIGAINVLKMVTCNPDPAEIAKSGSAGGVILQAQDMRKLLQSLGDSKDKVSVANQITKLFFVPFFIVHYGLFCMVHGAFILVFFGHNSFDGNPFDVGRDLLWDVARDRHLGWAVAGLAASHLYSFFRNYLGRGEYRRTVVPALMFQPYARVVVLHVAILFGAFIAVALGSNIGILAILIVGKTLLDLNLHLRERQRNAEPHGPIMPEQILDEAGAMHPTHSASER